MGKNALEASEGVVADSRAQAASMIAGDVTVETFEQWWVKYGIHHRQRVASRGS